MYVVNIRNIINIIFVYELCSLINWFNIWSKYIYFVDLVGNKRSSDALLCHLRVVKIFWDEIIWTEQNWKCLVNAISMMKLLMHLLPHCDHGNISKHGKQSKYNYVFGILGVCETTRGVRAMPPGIVLKKVGWRVQGCNNLLIWRQRLLVNN